MLDVATQKSYQERFAAIRRLEKEQILTSSQKTGLTLQSAGINAFFEYSGSTYLIKDLNTYEETSEDFKQKKGYFVHELTCFCIETGKTIHFEWEFDDELEISMTLEQLSFRDLKDDTGQGVDEDDLDQIADDKDAIVVAGDKFWYEDDWPALYYRGGREEKVYMYEFQNEDHSKFLTIEEWSGSGRDQYRLYTSSPVIPHAVEIISKGDA